MADIRESFPTTENSAGAGIPLTNSVSGSSASGANGLTGFAFQDSSGDWVLPQLDSNGNIKVIQGPATTLYANGAQAGSGSAVSIATITLSTSTTYTFLEALGACLRDTLFQVIWDNNSTLTTIAEFYSGSGQYTASIRFQNISFMTGSTGTQTLYIQGTNLNTLSEMRGTIAAQVLFT